MRRQPTVAAQVGFDFGEFVTHARSQQNMGDAGFSQIYQMALAHIEVPRQFFFREPLLALKWGFAVHAHACGVNRKLDFHRLSITLWFCATRQNRKFFFEFSIFG
jgi:hypothetical protein